MLCPTCREPFVADRLFCMNCGEISPEGARVMGRRPPAVVEEPEPVLALPQAPVMPVLPAPRVVLPPAVRPTSFSAILSLILGCLAWVGVPVLGALGAILSGHMARREIRMSAGRVGGGGIATIGLVLGYAQMALIVGVALAIAVAISAAIAFGG